MLRSSVPLAHRLSEYLIGDGFEVYRLAAMSSLLALRIANLGDADALGGHNRVLKMYE